MQLTPNHQQISQSLSRSKGPRYTLMGEKRRKTRGYSSLPDAHSSAGAQDKQLSALFDVGCEGPVRPRRSEQYWFKLRTLWRGWEWSRTLRASQGPARMEQWAGSGWGLLTKLKLSCELKACLKVDGQEGQRWGLSVIRAGEQSKDQSMTWKQWKGGLCTAHSVERMECLVFVLLHSTSTYRWPSTNHWTRLPVSSGPTSRATLKGFIVDLSQKSRRPTYDAFDIFVLGSRGVWRKCPFYCCSLLTHSECEPLETLRKACVDRLSCGSLPHMQPYPAFSAAVA